MGGRINPSLWGDPLGLPHPVPWVPEIGSIGNCWREDIDLESLARLWSPATWDGLCEDSVWLPAWASADHQLPKPRAARGCRGQLAAPSRPPSVPRQRS